ncbi:DUF2946 domain-containing protein [Bordetella bronchialis]|uniref:DUF2946 domain-containing protein n=2 Tax=Bordetella bronchialis TaxID=463025 RepID=A0ABN4R1F9_9BORD|nr:hypothetical protein BAU06_07280 [Bordetella bronchialis]
MRLHVRRQLTAWLGLIAMALVAFAPTVSHFVRAAKTVIVPICTTDDSQPGHRVSLLAIPMPAMHAAALTVMRMSGMGSPRPGETLNQPQDSDGKSAELDTSAMRHTRAMSDMSSMPDGNAMPDVKAMPDMSAPHMHAKQDASAMQGMHHGSGASHRMMGHTDDGSQAMEDCGYCDLLGHTPAVSLVPPAPIAPLLLLFVVFVLPTLTRYTPLGAFPSGRPRAPPAVS